MSNISNDIATTDRRCALRIEKRQRPRSVLLAVLFASTVTSCAAPGSTARDTIVAEGIVSVRGAEPFTELVLETSERNYYVLKFESQNERASVQDASPGFFRVEGDVYRGEWSGRAFAHLRVESITPASREP